MLVRFVIENFMSFKNETEFNMLAGSFKIHKHHVYDVAKIRLLRSSAIYGPNGSGKSNFIKAIHFFQELVSEGSLNHSITRKKFKKIEDNTKPISFEIEVVLNEKIYAYGFSLNERKVIKEWLYQASVKGEDKMIFERKIVKDKTNIKVANKYKSSEKQKLLIELLEDNILKSNELLISKEELKIDEIYNMKEWISSYLYVIHPHSKFQFLPDFIENNELAIEIIDILSKINVGIKSIDIEKMDLDVFIGKDDKELRESIELLLENNDSIVLEKEDENVVIVKENDKYFVKSLMFKHANDTKFNIKDESDGTQRILDLSPAFIGMINEKFTFVIDEVDRSLHTLLLKAFIANIMKKKNTKGQLIFTTHDSNILDLNIFRQDEIWFVEKDSILGESKLYSLAEYKPRYDLDIGKGYLKGRFGAIPFLGSLENLISEDYES